MTQCAQIKLLYVSIMPSVCCCCCFGCCCHCCCCFNTCCYFKWSVCLQAWTASRLGLVLTKDKKLFYVLTHPLCVCVCVCSCLYMYMCVCVCVYVCVRACVWPGLSQGFDHIQGNQLTSCHRDISELFSMLTSCPLISVLCQWSLSSCVDVIRHLVIIIGH